MAAGTPDVAVGLPGEHVPRPSSEVHRRLFLVGYYGHHNLGDDAILEAVSRRLRASLPSLQITVTAGGGRLPAGVIRVDPADLSAMSEAVRLSDLLALGGGGLLQDYWPVELEHLLTPGQGGLVQYLAGPVLAHLHGTPCTLLTIGAGPLATQSGREQAALAVELAGSGTVRDAASLDLLREVTPAADRLGVAADPAFLLEPSDDAGSAVPGLPTTGPVYAVALRMWPVTTGETMPPWVDQLIAAVDGLLRDRPGHVLLVPFDDAPATWSDRRLSEHVASRLPAGAATVLPPGRTPDEVAAVLARCDVVLAMRLHAAVLAALSGTPSACLAYDPKVQHVAAQLDLPFLGADAWTTDAVRGALDAALATSRETLLGRAQAQASSAAAAVDALAEQLTTAERVTASPAERLVRELALRRSLELLRTRSEASTALAAADVAQLRTAAALVERDQAQRSAAQLRQQVVDVTAERDAVTAERDDARHEAALARERERASRDRARHIEEQRDQLQAREQDLEDALAAAEFRLRALEEDLRLVKASPAYRLATPVWRAGGKLLPLGSRRRAGYHRVVAQVRRARDHGPGGAPNQPAAALAAATHMEELALFERTCRRRGAERVVLLLSGTQLKEDEGQRPTQLALELARLGVPVVFAYWRWSTDETCPQDRVDEGILQIPIDVVVDNAAAVASLFPDLRRTLLLAFPHPGFFELLARANAAGWHTVYDVLDDWEQFHEVGQAVWWDRSFEEHLTRSAGTVTAINQPLAELVGRPAQRHVQVVANGFRPGIEQIRTHRELERGEVTIGYFGHLTPAWFDWELLAAAAEAEPSWRWYVIGYGGEPSTALPSTVRLLGRQPQPELSGYAANWDVGVVPFRRTRLAECADPIKVYEYLAMGLPVVVTGVHPPPGSDAFVTRAEDAASFVTAVRAAARPDGDVEARRRYAQTSTWAARAASLLELADAPTRPAARS